MDSALYTLDTKEGIIVRNQDAQVVRVIPTEVPFGS
jgi:hypothetical protein